MMENKKSFKERKKEALNAAGAQGIADIVTSGREGISPELVMFASSLMAKHGKAANKRLEKRLKQQQKLAYPQLLSKAC